MKTFSSELIIRAMLLAFFCFGVCPAFADHEHDSHLAFTENKGQWESNILFRADFRGGRLFLEENNFMYVFYHPEDITRLHPSPEHTPPEFIRLHAVKVDMVGSNSSDRKSVV